jgi:hypothetical protein
MTYSNHKSWLEIQLYLPPKECKGISGFFRTLFVIRHLRWIIYFVQYYAWWLDSGMAGSGYFHHYEDIRFLLDIWKGNR